MLVHMLNFFFGGNLAKDGNTLKTNEMLSVCALMIRIFDIFSGCVWGRYV